MDGVAAKIVFEFAGSNANVINNLIGHSISVDNKRCNSTTSDSDGAMNLLVVGAEIIHRPYRFNRHDSR